MATRTPILGWSDVPYAGLVALFIALAVFFNYSGFLSQPYATFTLCGGVIGAFVIVLGWIRARSMAVATGPAPTVIAKKVPKVTARRIPKQEQDSEAKTK